MEELQAVLLPEMLMVVPVVGVDMVVVQVGQEEQVHHYKVVMELMELVDLLTMEVAEEELQETLLELMEQMD